MTLPANIYPGSNWVYWGTKKQGGSEETMSSMIRKAIDALRQFKLGIFIIALNRLLPDGFKFKSYIIYSYDMLGSPDEFPVPNSLVEVHKVENPEDELFKKFQKKYPAPEFLNRIEKKNEHAYIATKQGEVVAYAWVAEKKLTLDAINQDYPLNKDEIFLYSCYVSREHRGEGIHTLMIYERLKDFMKKGGYKTAYIGVLSVNKGSRKGIERAGFKEESRIRYLNIFGIEKWWGTKRPTPI